MTFVGDCVGPLDATSTTLDWFVDLFSFVCMSCQWSCCTGWVWHARFYGDGTADELQRSHAMILRDLRAVCLDHSLDWSNLVAGCVLETHAVYIARNRWSTTAALAVGCGSGWC